MLNVAIKSRNIYMDKIFSVLDNENMMIISGVRRAGKSCIAKHLEDEISKRFSNRVQIIRINFETIEQVRITAGELIYKLKEKYVPDKKNYIILDEVIHVIDWEKVVNSLYQFDNCKLILLSSNLCVFSNDLDAIQKEKYDKIDILPLSLEEFIEFQGFRETTDLSVPLQDKRYQRFAGKVYKIEDIYKYYINYGGLPIMKPEYMDRELAWVVMDGSYGAIVTRDIMEMGSNNGSSSVADTLLLRAIITIMAKSLGDNITATWICKQTADYIGRAASIKTVESYINALLNAHLFYIAERFDIKTGKIMKTFSKYYIVDASFHNYVAEIRVDDENRLLENKIFFELLRRGYAIYNGKIGKEKISFVAIKGDEKIYIQVAKSMNKRHINSLSSPFRKILDDAVKMIIVPECESGITNDGYVLMNALEFLIGTEFKQCVK